VKVLVKATNVLKRYYKKGIRFLKQYYGKAIQHPRILITLGFIAIAIVLLWYPQFQVSKFGITNPKDLANAENSYRATLAQIFGGFALLLGLYFTWGNLVTAKESQITERFTRAIEQFGNEKMEIRLGGIYALGRIAKESKKNYWPIVKILTAYVREKSPLVIEPCDDTKIPTEIQVILEVLFNHENSLSLYNDDKDLIYLQNVNLNGANLTDANLKLVRLNKASLKNANLGFANFESANLNKANLEKAHMWSSNLKYADLIGANLEKADLSGADLENAKLVGANLRWADLSGAHLKEATCKEADFTKANLQRADLTGVYFLTLDQLSKAKSLYGTKLDEELSNALKDKHPELFENPLTEEEIKRRMEILTSLGAVPCNRE
jgi:uncharacterized protein YjbI with pentapeptide repeats